MAPSSECWAAKLNGSPPYTGCHVEVDPLGSPKTPRLAWRPIKFSLATWIWNLQFGGHRPSPCCSNWVLYMVLATHSTWQSSECWADKPIVLGW